MKKTGIFLALLLIVIQAFSQKEIEKLNRGLIAFNKNGVAYINWRLFALEDFTVGFNVYRSVDGGVFTKINSTAITKTTDYLDKTANVSKSNTYYVVPLVGGVEQAVSEKYTLVANTPSRQFFPFNLEPIPGKAFTDYTVVHIYPGDFDGDGDFDYLVKRVPVDTKYNTILLDCYDNEGTFKWRIDLGPNVETYIGTMTSPVLVADFDSDGKADIICKTGESTIFGDGYKIPDTNGDGKTDYNGHQGYGNAANIMEGPEFISFIDGETGKERDRNNFLSRRNPYKDWGDTYGARMNFMMSSVGYFDGVHPACVFSRGDGGDMDVDAWQIVNGKLKQIWYFTARGKTFSPGWWTDFHQIQCIDVDGDGKDEISWGSCMLNGNGTLRYTTKYCHGDRFQITDINPRRPGLEVFIVQQNNTSLIGSALYDASTGKTIKDWYIPSLGDIGRGDVADIDPNSPGMEMFDTGNPNLHASDGTEIASTKPYPWVSIYWDGDLLRENLIGVGNGGYNPAINKWNPTTKSEDRLFSIYNDWGAYSVTQPYGGRVPLVGDIFGDWREEIFLETSDRTQVRIYSSSTPSEARLYTLMQNPSYRTAITTKGYLCSKYPDYFLGAGMSTPPKPNIKLISVNQKPVISLDSPLDKGVSIVGVPVTLSATATDDGKVAQVVFYATNKATNVMTTLSTDVTAPYSFNWTPTVATTYYLVAKVTDDKGLVTNSNILTYYVSSTPTVTLSTSGISSITAGSSLALAIGNSNIAGTITKAEYYSGTTLIGTSTTSPYSFTWNNVAAGTYKLTVVVTDNTGTKTTSPIENVTVIPPLNYVYEHDASGDLKWTNTNSWTPKSLPTAIDTAIIRTGEVQISQEYAGTVTVEPNGIFRVAASVSIPFVRLQGGTLKSYTSNPLFVLTSTVTAGKPSSIMAGSVASSVFELAGVLNGSTAITKTSVGILRLNTDATAYTGNWNIAEGTLQIANTKSIGSNNSVTVSSGATIDIQIADLAVNILSLGNGILNLDFDATATKFSIKGLSVPAGIYTASDYPGTITGSGTLTVLGGADCAGVEDGTAFIDHCGTCVSGSTGLTACTMQKLQAEDICEFDGTIDTNNAGFEGLGFVNIANVLGAKASLYLYANETSTVIFGVNYANGTTPDRDGTVIVNGTMLTSSLSLPSTGAWTKYLTVEMRLPLQKGLNKIDIVANTDNGLPNLDFFVIYGDARFATCPVTQVITLHQGWNLISTNVHPTDSMIETVFEDLDLLEVKDMDGFWRTTQAFHLNSLTHITAGKGYLVKMNTAATLTITGTPIEIGHGMSLHDGWNLIGCPYPVATSVAGILGSNFSAIKNFEGFNIPNNAANSIQDIEPGKAYFVK